MAVEKQQKKKERLKENDGQMKIGGIYVRS